MPTLYFSPLAGSLAARVACHHHGLEVDFVEVELIGARVVATGGDYRDVHPLAQVPALRQGDGHLLTGIPAVLREIAALAGAPPHAEARRELAWMVFLGTELHKAIFRPLFDPASNDGAKAYARSKVASRFAYLDAALRGRDTLLEGVSLADMYLYTLLNWTRASGIDLSAYPALEAAQTGYRARRAFKQAFAEELPLFQSTPLARGQRSG